MGLRGSVRRAQDGHYIHTNCDTGELIRKRVRVWDTGEFDWPHLMLNG